jgi:hypothetical protein
LFGAFSAASPIRSGARFAIDNDLQMNANREMNEFQKVQRSNAKRKKSTYDLAVDCDISKINVAIRRIFIFTKKTNDENLSKTNKKKLENRREQDVERVAQRRLVEWIDDLTLRQAFGQQRRASRLR